jgi:5-methylcytosine-specific restriction endonuclease McrA
MPERAYHQCSKPGCSELIKLGSRCLLHAVDKQRPNANARGYDYAWRKVRTAFLQKHPWCSDPFGDHAGQLVRATQVDHVLPKSVGGTDAESNLDGKCDHCHDKKTALLDGGFGNKKSSEGRGGQNV